jgi:hypothetical protein
MFPWIEHISECQKTAYNIDLYTFRVHREILFTLKKKEQFKKSIDLFQAMQTRLLFPFRNDIPFSCSAAILIYHRNENTFYASIPQYPLYYGYKMLLVVNAHNLYDVIFNPDIEKIFQHDTEILKEINFIHMPCNLTDKYLLDSNLNEHLKTWLLTSSTNVINLSDEVHTHLEIQSNCFDLLEINKYIIDFIQLKSDEDTKLQEDRILDHVYTKLNKVDSFSSLITFLQEENCKIIYNDNKLIKETIQAINLIENECTNFLKDTESVIKQKQNIGADGEIEETILHTCDNKVNECNRIIDELSKRIPPCVFAKLTEFFSESIVFNIYHQMTFCCDASNSHQLIYVDLDAFKKTQKMLYTFLTKRNAYKEGELLKSATDEINLFDSITNDFADISMYTLACIKNFLTFHTNAINVYPTIQTDTLSQTTVNRSSKEFIYYKEIHRKGKISKEIYRHGILMQDHIKHFVDLFEITNYDENIQDIFRRGLSIFPSTFWKYTEDICCELNEMSKYIGIYTGCIQYCCFDMQFPTENFMQGWYILTSEDDVTKYIDSLQYFTVSTPTKVTNFTFSVIPQNLSFNKAGGNEQYKKHIGAYVKQWEDLYKEFLSTRNKLHKQREHFNNTINDILKLNTENLSQLHKQICMKTNNNWENIVHFLSLMNIDKQHNKLYITLDELNQHYSEELKSALTRCNVVNCKPKDNFTLRREQLQLVGHIVNLAYKQLYQDLIEPIIDIIENTLKNEEDIWKHGVNKHRQKWSEDFSIITQDGPNQFNDTISFKEGVNHNLIPVLNLLKTVYSKDILNKDMITMVNPLREPEWKFCQILRDEEKIEIKRLPRSIHVNMDNILETDIKEMLNGTTCTYNEKTNLKFYFSYYMATFVIEFLKKFDVYSLLMHLKTSNINQIIDFDDLFNIADKVLVDFPCYGLVYIIDVNELLLSSDGSSTLNHQIAIHKKICATNNHDLKSKQKKSSTSNMNKLYRIGPPNIEEHFDCLLDILTANESSQFSISLELFKTLMLENYWVKHFKEDMKTLQTCWANARKCFCFKNDKRSRKTFPYFSITGTTHVRILPFFQDSICNEKHFIKSISLITNNLNSSEYTDTTDSDSDDYEITECKTIEDWKKANHLDNNGSTKLNSVTPNLANGESDLLDNQAEPYVVDIPQDDMKNRHYDSFCDSDNQDEYIDDTIDQFQLLCLTDDPLEECPHIPSQFNELEDSEDERSIDETHIPNIVICNKMLIDTSNFAAHKELINDKHWIKHHLHKKSFFS